MTLDRFSVALFDGLAFHVRNVESCDGRIATS